MVSGGAVHLCQARRLSRPADEFEAIRECDRNLVGEEDAEKRTKSDYVYDTLGRRWLIAHDRADEIIRCLVEQHGWVASIVPEVTSPAVVTVTAPVETIAINR